MVGREHELARLQDLLQEGARGAGGAIVLLSGEAGIGKTRLAQELIEFAGRDGWECSVGSAREHVGAPAYWPWISALRGPLLERFETHVMSAEPEQAQRLMRVLTGTRPTGDPASAEFGQERIRFLLADHLATFLNKEATTSPRLIVLEDLHWADQQSLQVLETVASALGNAPLSIVATFRDDELARENPLTQTLAVLAVQPRTQRIRLQRLSVSGVRQLLAHASGKVPNSELVSAVHQRTDGNPFFAQEVVTLLLEHGDALTSEDALRVSLPDTVRGAIARRLNHLSDHCVELLGLAAVLGPESDLLTFQRVGRTYGDIDGALSEAFQAGILAETSGETRGYRFSHLLIREELYEGLGAAKRQRLHRLVGESLEELSGAADLARLSELAFHFREAAPVSGAAKAIEYLRQAAEGAAAQFAWPDAIRDLEAAMSLQEQTAGGEPETRIRLMISLGLARAKSGDEPRAVDVLREATDSAIALAEPTLAATAADAYARWASVASGGSDSIEVVPRLERALELLASGHGALRGKLLGQLATCSLYLPVDAPLAAQTIALSDEAIALASESSDRHDLPEALVHAFRAHWPPNLIERRAELADELLAASTAVDDVSNMLSGHVYSICVLLERGEIDVAERRVEQVEDLAEQFGSARHRAYAHLHRAWIGMLRGDFDAAEEHARTATAVGVQVTESFGMAALANAWRAQGRLHDCLDELREDAFSCDSASVQLALVRQALGDEAEALTRYRALASSRFETLERDADRAPALAGLAELCASFGDVGHAPLLYSLLEPYRHVFGVSHVGVVGAIVRYLGLLAALMGRDQVAVADFEQALELNGQSGARPWHAWTQADYAALLIRRGEVGDARRSRDLLAEARATARALKMTPLVERCRELESALEGASLVPPDGLTPREVEVLCLIADGSSNADVAERLVLSVRTVERHITNLYGKIGARGRADAASYAISHELIEAR